MKRFAFYLPWAALALACPAFLPGQESKGAAAPGFVGRVFGLDVTAERLGLVLDISESMTRSLPAVKETLRQQFPKTPALHVDGCGLTKPAPGAKVRNGVADETVTAVDLLARFAQVTAVLWISDMADPPNKDGIQALKEILHRHGITLYLVSVNHEPGPSLRKLVEQGEGGWKVITLSRD